MWSEATRERFQALRSRELAGELTSDERLELAGLVRELETAEASRLDAAAERLRQERQRTEAQNQALAELVRRQETLAERLRNVLQEATAERRAIREEADRLLAGRGS